MNTENKKIFEKKFITSLKETIKLRESILNNTNLMEKTIQAAELVVKAYRDDKKVLLAGNGGSAADAQHLAAELVGRFYYDRAPLNAEAISTNTSDLTCLGNDYGYEFIFSRAVQAKGRKGDIFIAISTSGKSPNIIKAAQVAKQNGLPIVALTGATGGMLAEYADILINVPSTDTARIQECHITLGHLICEFVEAELFPR